MKGYKCGHENSKAQSSALAAAKAFIAKNIRITIPMQTQ